MQRRWLPKDLARLRGDCVVISFHEEEEPGDEDK
jgi:hypothetical protein